MHVSYYTQNELKNFAKNLRQERLNNGYTQVELAEKTGIASGMLSLYERGRFFPSIERLNTLSDALGVTAEYMLEEHVCPDVITREQKTNFIKNLRRERLKKGYTLAKLSEKTGIHLVILSQYETGCFFPRPEKMKNLSDALEVDLGHMLENKDGDDVPSQVCLKEISINVTRRRLTKKEKEAFARNLEQERLKKGYSQKELAEKTGISRVSLNHYEIGRMFPRDYSIDKILDALGVDMDYMLEDRPYENSKERLKRIKSFGLDIGAEETRVFALNLRKEREKRGYTQAELSKLVGINCQAISTYETQRRFPSDQTMSKLLEVLDVDLEYMLNKKPL